MRPADDTLESAQNPLRDSGRANDNATDHSLVSCDPITGNIKGGCGDHGEKLKEKT